MVHLTTVPISLAYLAGHITAQVKAGYRVHVISSPGPDLERFCSELGAVAHPVEVPRQIHISRDLRALSDILGELHRIAPDVVHAHTPKAGLLGVIAAWLLRVPLRIYHCHGLRFETATSLTRRILRETERTACGLATLVLTVSESMRRLMVTEGLCPEAKVRVPLQGSIGGVDAEGRFRPAEPAVREAARRACGIPVEARVLGFVGRLVRDKGIVEIFQAWRALRARMPDLHWLVVGPFEDGDPIPPDIVAGMCEDERVHLTGLEWNTPRMFGAMDVLALPSYREGFPVVLLEAAAMELPVVASRATGCADAVVDGATGALVGVGDAVELEQALARYLEDAALRRAHGQAARRRVLADFRPEHMHLAVQRLYEAALRGHGAA
ncbi:MAG: glycosyltransferase family 4 protein [Thermoanaerobaculia bacterium]|nr:glycosyltransferase family 4 protein [Thermoanaerobaculia bacterium]